MSKILINAANLHVGGGVQVAVSFIWEMVQLTDHDCSGICVIVSRSVDQGLAALNADTSVFRSYRVIDLVGVGAFFSPLNLEIKEYDVVFTVFGPNYLRAQAKQEVVGFAQSWIFGTNSDLAGSMGVFSKLRSKFKRWAQWQVFKRAHLFLVELEHVERKLVATKNVEASRVEVVHNCASSLYFDESLWGHIDILKETADLHLGIISRDYSHKNLSILPCLAIALYETYNLHVRFYVTFNVTEWELKDDIFRKYVTNVGALLPSQCPSFYRQMDGVIFPSLLECFSATPLEALVMRKPLFASDREFVRDICGDHAFYFNPMDIDCMARAIFDGFCCGAITPKFLDDARIHAVNFSNAKDRARNYLRIINADGSE